MKRRDFNKSTLSLLLGSPLLVLCTNNGPEHESDFELSNDPDQIARMMKKNVEIINMVPKNLGNVLKIGIGEHLFSFQCFREDEGFYLRISKSASDFCDLRWGWDNLTPSVKVRRWDGAEIEKSYWDLEEKDGEWSMAKTLIKVFALALGFWLGASLAKLLLGTLAYVAFHVMMLAIFVFSLIALKKILELLGIEWEDIEDFLVELVNQIKDILEDII